MANQYLSLIEVDSILNTTITNSTITINTYSKLLPYLPLPFVCLFGIITNSLNIAVFANSKMKDLSFKYMLIISICDLGNYCFYFTSTTETSG